MPLNLPPQTSLFFEREVICQSSIIEHWPHRQHPLLGATHRWHIHQNINALRSMRNAQQAYDEGLLSLISAKTKAIVQPSYRTGGRRRKSHG